MAQVSARCGGIYAAHLRNEGPGLLPALQESVDIARASGAPAEIYHFKQAGKEKWRKLDAAVALIESARAQGVRITADMYAIQRRPPAWTPPCRAGSKTAAWRRGSND